MIEYWKNAHGKRYSVAALILHFSKAFDWVNHEIILKKPSIYTLDQAILVIFKNYLSVRPFVTVLNGKLWRRPRMYIWSPSFYYLRELFSNLPELFSNLPELFSNLTELFSKLNNNILFSNLPDEAFKGLKKDLLSIQSWFEFSHFWVTR